MDEVCPAFQAIEFDWRAFGCRYWSPCCSTTLADTWGAVCAEDAEWHRVGAIDVFVRFLDCEVE